MVACAQINTLRSTIKYKFVANKKLKILLHNKIIFGTYHGVTRSNTVLALRMLADGKKTIIK